MKRECSTYQSATSSNAKNDRLAEENFEQSFLSGLFRAAGFALLFTWLFATLLDFRVFPSILESIVGFEYPFQAIKLVSFGIGLWLGYIITTKCSFSLNRKSIIVIFVLVVTITLLTLSDITIVDPLAFAITFLMNLFGGYLIVSWMHAITRSSTLMTPFFLAAAVAFSALLGYLLTSLPYPFNFFFIMVILLISIAMMIFLNHKRPVKISHEIAPATREEPAESEKLVEIASGDNTSPEAKAPRIKRSFSWRAVALFGIFGFGFGFGYAAFTEIPHEDWAFYFFAIAIGAVMAIIDMWQAGGILIDRVRRIVVVSAIAALLAIIVVWNRDELFWWCVIFALFTYSCIMQTNWMIVSNKLLNFDVATLYVREQWLFWIMVAAGWFTSWLLWEKPIEYLIVLCVLVASIIIMSLFYAQGDLEQFWVQMSKDDTAANITGVSEERNHRFKDQCSLLAKRFDLTSRETDVFILLAKGYSTRSIGDELSISEYTAKTHICHVYQKVGFNSRQAIIALVEKSIYKTEASVSSAESTTL